VLYAMEGGGVLYDGVLYAIVGVLYLFPSLLSLDEKIEPIQTLQLLILLYRKSAIQLPEDFQILRMLFYGLKERQFFNAFSVPVVFSSFPELILPEIEDEIISDLTLSERTPDEPVLGVLEEVPADSGL